ncbi:esterase-like activity of phytase family protein [uncultured Roseobacter sp.]|uniref:esterase-like activity of phytase family protein n=1 Tax=uncultured Roseobacter sp. TaxID=114847 RepID=UPI002626F1F8|nr:esterase-like activity of phytase family protein [uncultured Roseobacter sp.]
MRRRFTVPLIFAMGVAPWFALKPAPPAVPPGEQPAQLSAVIPTETEADWAGGFSGIEVTADGSTWYLVTDRGHVATGTFTRQNGTLTGATIAAFQPLVDQYGNERDFPHTDAEGLALDDTGRLNVSFEHAHRVLRYNTWDAPAVWPSYTRSWRALPQNGGMEALAISADGTLFAIPEGVASGAWEALVYRRTHPHPWEQPFTLPLAEGFKPTGADFGPDGRLYLLERGLYPFGFRSQIRSMAVTDTGFEDIRVILQTPLFTHGNLEGIAVWRDGTGQIRLTMVSDDNFLPVLRSEIVEYILTD